MKGIALTALATALAGWLLKPWLGLLPPVCIFRLSTGRPCIFCGLTHALAYAMQGDWSLAWQANPMWWMIVPLFVVTLPQLVTGKKGLGWRLVGFTVAGTVARALLS